MIMNKLLLTLFLITTIAYSQPNIGQPNDLIQCNNIQGGFYFNLTQNNTQILNGLPPALYAVKFFNSLSNAQNNLYPISNQSNYFYYSGYPSTIYVRVEEYSNPSNFALTNFNLVISNSVNLAQPPSLYYYGSYNGTGTFNLTSKNSILLNGIQPSSVSISYYTSLSNAQYDLNAISNPTNFTSYYNNQTIYVKVVDLVTGCYTIKSFELIAPGYNDIIYIPDANFKQMLLSGNNVGYNTNYSFNELSFSCGPGNDVIGVGPSSVVIDTNYDNEIQVSEALAITYLNLYGYQGSMISDLTGIEAFASLHTLNCGNNLLTSLNLTQNQGLRYLDCSKNPITSFSSIQAPSLYELYCFNLPLFSIVIPSNSNLKRLECGNFINGNLINLDISQAPNLLYLKCYSGAFTNLNLMQNTGLKGLDLTNVPLSSLNLASNINLISLQLYNVPLTTIDVSQNTNLQFLSISNSTISSLNIGSNASLRHLSLNGLPITNLDVSQNLQLCHASIQNLQLSVLDFSSNTNMGSITCINNPLLIYLNVKNGSSQLGNFGPQINNNPSLQFVCSDEFEITSIQNSVGTSAFVSSYCTFVPGGNYNTIVGDLIFDSDSNGCDANDPTHSNIKIEIVNGANQGATFSNALGSYSFFTQAGSFTLTPSIENPTWFTFSPINATIPFANSNNNTVNQNFCFAANGIHNDVEVVVIPQERTSPGFDSAFKIVYKNKGNQALSGTISFGYDEAVLDYVSSTQTPISISAGNIDWSYSGLQPFESRSFMVTLNVNSPVETPPVNQNDILIMTATINPISGDESPLDNVFELHRLVINSLDPNDKVCLEGITVPTSKIGEYLHYTINFENVGNADAANIVVKDLIDIAKFEVNSLQIVDSSHPMETRVTGNRVEFIFEDINLGPNEHGNVVFKIKTKSTLVEGNTVTNKANIYFDYNFPIETNTASTTFQTLSNGQFQVDNSVVIAPNPTKNNVNVNTNINVNNKIKSIELYDVQGRVLMTQMVNDSQTSLDISNYVNGVYFVKVNTEIGTSIEKIIKE